MLKDVALVVVPVAVAALICWKICTARIRRASSYLMEERHPAMQIFFLSLVTGCVGLFLSEGWNRFPNRYVGSIQKLILPFLVTFVYAAFWKACRSNPGIITQANVERACHAYDYDGIIYNPSQCRTCKLQKPARSKHCSVCKVCVAKLDHHCAWINNCVGQLNYRYFVLFLVSVMTLTFYGTWLIWGIMRAEMDARQVDNLWVRDPSTHHGHRRLDWWEKIVYMVHRESILAAIGLFALLAGIIVLLFTSHELYMTLLRGMTTNETFKWGDLAHDIKTQELHISAELYEYNQSHGRQDTPVHVSSRDEENKSETKTTRRRKTSQQPKRPPQEAQGQDIPLKSLKQVRNIYDRGIWGNLKEMIFPPSL
ncbi:DHHC palmitoyltransferase-domain-containing protein [Gaertneriomyces semiglobifer]|nr:DHHC palmitoyltransferase-domain-containing protein [Gaertneriomyces semiglobifer]